MEENQRENLGSQRAVQSNENDEGDEKRESMRRLLKERIRARDEMQQLNDHYLGYHSEGDRNELEERRRQREQILLQRLEKMADKKRTDNRKIDIPSKSSSTSVNPFWLFRLKKLNYRITIQYYFCDMLMKSPPTEEVLRMFECFKETFLDVSTTYPNFPILFLDQFDSPLDRNVILSLIDAQDTGGFTALHWAVHEGNLEQIEMLLANGANTELKSFVAKHKPIDRADAHPEVIRSAINELFRRYQSNDNNVNKSYNRNHIVMEPYTSDITNDSEEFPFLDLPLEVQVLVLEKLTIQHLTRVLCVCKYFKELQILRRLTELPEIEVVKFSSVDKAPQCCLTVMATPTIFHYGIIMGLLYQTPSKKGAVRVIKEMIGKIAKNDRTFKYNLKKLENFLLNSWRMKRRIYILNQMEQEEHYAIYVEVDSHFGVGVEFVIGEHNYTEFGNTNDNWNFQWDDFGYYPMHPS